MRKKIIFGIILAVIIAATGTITIFAGGMGPRHRQQRTENCRFVYCINLDVECRFGEDCPFYPEGRFGRGGLITYRINLNAGRRFGEDCPFYPEGRPEWCRLNREGQQGLGAGRGLCREGQQGRGQHNQNGRHNQGWQHNQRAGRVCLRLQQK